MDPDRWKLVDNLLQAVLERPPEEREAFLREASWGDEELEREVRSLLTWRKQADSFLERPALEMATGTLTHAATSQLLYDAVMGNGLAAEGTGGIRCLFALIEGQNPRRHFDSGALQEPSRLLL